MMSMGFGSAYSVQDTMKKDTMATAPVSEKDAYVAKKVHDYIGEGWFSKGYDQVKAKVENGVVTLTGTVSKLSDKDKIEKEIRNIDGVKKVESHLVVQDKSSDKSYDHKKFAQDTFASPSDEQLNKKIRENVSEGWFADSYKDVALHTSNGVVTLVGKVKDSDAQSKLVDKIKKVEGVKSVNSNLKYDM